MENGDLACAEVLVQWGADLNAQDSHGRTPMHLAASLSDDAEGVYMMEWLAGKKADADIRDLLGRTPADLAMIRGNQKGATVALKREHQQGSLVLDQEASEAMIKTATPAAAEAQLNDQEDEGGEGGEGSTGSTGSEVKAAAKPGNSIAKRRRSVQLLHSLGSMDNAAHNSVSGIVG